MPGPSPAGRAAQATIGRSSSPRPAKAGAATDAFSLGETCSTGPKAPNTGRRAASTRPSPSDCGSICTQLTSAAVPLVAAATDLTGRAAGDSAVAGAKRPSGPETDTFTRVLGPSGVAGAPGSPPAQARIAPRPSAGTRAGELAATPSACSRRCPARKRLAPTGRTHAST